MRKIKFVLFALSLTVYAFGNNDNKNGTIAYIDAYVEIAVSEMNRTGIPASIKLAQAILESNAGKSEMALTANNHFGIKCGKQWMGASYYKVDDDKDHRGKLIESCFRVYKDAGESFIAHSNFLQNNGKPSRYSFLFEYKTTDYKKWAKGLRKAGYATDPHYPQKLINLIEKYELYRYDDMGSAHSNHLASKPSDSQKSTNEGKLLSEKPSKEKRVKRSDRIASKTNNRKKLRYKYVNDAKMTVAQGGETLNDISNYTGIALASLIAYNDDTYGPYDPIPADMPIFVEKKRLSLKGKQKYHEVTENERMQDIAQHYGIELNALYIRNRIPFGSEVRPGEEIMLKGMIRTGSKPKLIKKNKSGLVEKSRFVEETVEYIFSSKNGKKD